MTFLVLPIIHFRLAKLCSILLYVIKSVVVSRGLFRSAHLHLTANVGLCYFILCFCYVTERLRCWVGSI
jgi:hypothetical protein